MRRLLLPVLVMSASLVGVTCARMTLPDGLGEEDIQGVTDAYGQAAMLPCTVPIIGNRAVVTAEGSVRGIADGRRIRGQLWIGIDIISGSLRLESVHATPSEFVFIANAAFKGQNDTSDVESTLVLPRSERVVQESSRRLLEAIIGFPLTAQEFMWALTGCPSWSGSIVGRKFGDTFMKVWVGDVLPLEVLLRRKDIGAPWTLLTMARHVDGEMFRWRAEFNERVRGLFRAIRMVSQDWNGEVGRAFDIRLSLSRIQVGPAIGPETFSLVPPRSARRVSLDTLREQRPRPALPLVNDAPPIQ